VARINDAHAPRSSTLVFVPLPQFKVHLYSVWSSIFKTPPTPKRVPFCCAALSNQARALSAGSNVVDLLDLGAF